MIQLNIDYLCKDVAHILPKSMKKYSLLFLINLPRQITQSSCCLDQMFQHTCLFYLFNVDIKINVVNYFYVINTSQTIDQSQPPRSDSNMIQSSQHLLSNDKSGNNLNDTACRLYNFIANPSDGERVFFFSDINLSSFFKKTNSVSSQVRNEKINITQKRIIQINITFLFIFIILKI